MSRPIAAPRGALGLLAIILASGLIGCGRPAPSPTSVPSASPSVEPIDLVVRFGGSIQCASFPQSCGAVLSVLPAGSEVADDWRPDERDPSWAPDYGSGTTASTFEAEPLRGAPTVPPGPHRLVVSLIGEDDLASLDAAGNRATELLGRCALDVDLPPGSGPVDVLVTFVPDPAAYRATCTVEIAPVEAPPT